MKPDGGLNGSAEVGVGLRQAHYSEWVAHKPPLGFVEVHSENFFAPGGAALAVLEAVRATHAVSLHGVGLSLGSACGLDAWHLSRLADLVQRIDPVRVSDHACFARVQTAGHPAVHASDLLPVAFTQASLDILVSQVEQVQDRLQRPILVEHLSAYVMAHDADMDERQFLMTLCQRSGCGLLLDLNNLMVNGLNRARQAWLNAPHAGVPAPEGPDLLACQTQALAEAQDWVGGLPRGMVGEVHLAGCRWPASAHDLVIDDHSQRVSPACWALFEHTLAHLGRLPTLIEWDTDVPPLSVLLDEARLAHLALLSTPP